MMPTVDGEIQVPSAMNPELSEVLPCQLGEGQNIASHALPGARDSAV